MIEPNVQNPVVSVVIPCYEQLALARRSVASVLDQGIEAMEVIIVDDGASDEYAEFASDLADPRVTYVRNTVRLGAMRNMFKAIRLGRGIYTLAFHEDDILGEGYLAGAIDLLERHPKCGFVAGELRFFDDEPDDEPNCNAPDAPSFRLFETGAELLRVIFRGVEPMFGSVVYRRAAVESVNPPLEAMGTLCDRPFLLSIMERWQAILMSEPRVYCQRHSGEDTRHESLTPQHVREFLRAYRATFPGELSRSDRAALTAYAQAWLPALHKLIPAQRRPPLRKLLLYAVVDGVYDPRALRLSDVRRAARWFIS